MACKLDSTKYKITIYEKNAALGRKFLVAGKGGFNLTHSESKEKFIEKYTPQNSLLQAFNQFDNTHFIVWLKSIGIQTFVGTSNRVFPKKGIKPIEVLNAIERELKKNNVEIKFGCEFKGWFFNPPSKSSGQAEQDDGLATKAPKGLVFTEASHTSTPCLAGRQEFRVAVSENNDIVIFSLGGSSWSVTGSDGSWANYFKEKGIDVKPFLASNCAFKVEWNEAIKKKLVGEPIKNAAFNCGSKRIMGEAVFTEFGIEGSGVYPLCAEIRASLFSNISKSSGTTVNKGHSIITIDFKPELSISKIAEILLGKDNMSMKDVLLKKIKLSETAFQLIKLSTTKEEYNSPDILMKLIKNFPVNISDLAPIDEAISTVGGIPFTELSENFELKKMPNTYCIGEMVDWDAPTGGYLLQMCFSMGFYLGDYLNCK